MKSIAWFGAVMVVLAAAAISRADASQGATAAASGTITPEMIERVLKGDAEELTISFRAKDTVPVQLLLEGDLFERQPNAVVPLKVKRDFFVRIKKNELLFSFDGRTFSTPGQALKGSLTIGGISQDPAAGFAKGISLILQAEAK